MHFFCYVLENDISDLDEYEFQNDVIYGNENVNNFPYKHMLNKRKIVEDCCHKACSREYIKSYCRYNLQNTL